MNEVVIDGIIFNFQLNPIKCSPNHPLDLTAKSPSAAYLLALLIGGINISDEKFSATQCKNYMIIGAPSASAFVSQNLEHSFPDLREDIKGKSFFLPGKKLILEYLSSQRSNHALFSPLLNEVSRAIINNNNGRGLSAFVHIYRALESSSYSFPLFYCRYEREYLKVFTQLREFFKGGELDFCNNFFQHLLKSDDLLGVPVVISFNGRHSAEFVSCMVSDVSWITDKKTGINSISRNSQNSIEIKFEHCFDLIVRLRNGFFHHLSGSNSNIPSSKIKDADKFFEPINEVALQVLAYMFGKIIKGHI